MVLGCKSSALLPEPTTATDQVDLVPCLDHFPHRCHQHPGHEGCRWGSLLGLPHKPGSRDSSSAPFLGPLVAQLQSPGHWCCLPEPEEAQELLSLGSLGSSTSTGAPQRKGPSDTEVGPLTVCSHSPAQMKPLHPLLQSCRQDLQPSQHPCLQGRKWNQSPGELHKRPTKQTNTNTEEPDVRGQDHKSPLGRRESSHQTTCGRQCDNSKSTDTGLER